MTDSVLRDEKMVNGHAARNEETFSTWAIGEEEYFRWQAEKVTLIQQTLRRLPSEGTLADVGCFTGLATEFYRNIGFDQAVGFDACEDVFPALARRDIEPRRWLAGEERCPAADGEFKVVIAADVIEHIVDTDSFVRELHRVLHPDGWLIVTTPNLAFWLSRIRLLLGKLPWSYPGVSPTVRTDIKVDLNHIRVSTRQEWQALFQSHSFTVVDVAGWSILHAIEGNLGVRARKTVDRLMTRFPDVAFGLLFLLRKSNAPAISTTDTLPESRLRLVQ